MKNSLKACSVALATLFGASNANAHTPFSLSDLLDQTYWHLGGTQITFETESKGIFLSDLGPSAGLAIEEGQVEGGTEILGDTQPVLTMGYRFKRFPRLSVEGAIAPPFQFDFQLTGKARDESLAEFALCPTQDTSSCLETGIPALGADFGTSQALPAVLTGVYSFDPIGRFHPYIGAGLTYVITFNREVTNETLTENGNPKLEIETAPGAIFQLGVNTRLTKRLMLTTDIKVSSMLDVESKVTDITLVSPTVGDVLGPTTIGEASADVSVRATAVSVALRYNF